MGDFSRNTFIATKHHSDVRLQQGRVLLDADWNEQMDIQKHRTETEAIDTIGSSGVPKANNGFEIGAGPTGKKLLISAGRIYVDGFLCELENPATYFNQPHLPEIKEDHFGPATADDPETRPLADGSYLVYLDAWQREVNFHDDPYIQEVALGEADTSTRMQTVWQVELLKVTLPASGTLSCETDFPEWNSLIAPVTGKMNVRTKRSTDPKDPCSLPPTTGFRRLENQFYRVEVQKGTDRTNSTFKWSRDNATVETVITDISGVTVTVSDLGKDYILGFATGQWVEITDDISSLMSRPKTLFEIINIDIAELKITLGSAPSLANDGKKRKLRRWDQDGAEVSMNTGGWIDLEDGIQISFTTGTYKPGNYWTFAARTATGEVEWAPFAIPNIAPVAQLPAGITHHYARLATLGVSEGIYTPKNCRKKFPSLTTIAATDVAFDNTNCQLSSAKNVQEAIDLLCGTRSGGSCTITAFPGPGWESVFEKITEGQDAMICFQVGDYPLTSPAKIANKGHLKFNGCGHGTRILATSQEAALVFDSCKSVLIRDMYVEAGIRGESVFIDAPDLNGAVTCISCASVDIEHVDFKCNSVSSDASTCLTVRNTAQSPGSVRISSCDLLVGSQQQGMLLVNTSSVSIADNTLTVTPRFTRPTLRDIAANKLWRAAFRQVLFNSPTFNLRRGGGNAQISIGEARISFTTPNALRRAWQELLNSNPPQAATSQKNILNHIKKLSDRLLTDEQFLSRNPAFVEYIKAAVAQIADAATRGITLGGTIAREIRITNNLIKGFQQGIHVGLSHRLANQEDFDQAGNVQISGNTIHILLTEQAIKQDRHGIFVGHCKNLIIENNNITLTRQAETERLAIDGIRVWGILGERLMITQNSVVSADGSAKNRFMDGIRVNPLNEKPRTAQWMVMWNVAPSNQNTVIVSNGAVNVPGTNTP